MHEILNKYPALEPCLGSIEQAYSLMEDTYRQGGKVLTCGNGGSAADAEHIVGELMKGFMSKRKLPETMRARLISHYPEEGAYLADHLQGALPAISLVSQVSLMTAFANDVAADMVFAQQVYGYGRAGDTLIAISTSGNSSNVLHAARIARTLGLHTIGLTGFSGGTLKEICDVTICVPGKNTPEVQEYHLPIYHYLCTRIEARFFA
jgi:D-sedoheptulose 7-phosphate isomerase